MIRFLPKFSLPNRAYPTAFTAVQKPTASQTFVYPTMSGGWTVFYPSSGAVQTRIAYVDPVGGHATGLIYDYGNAVVGNDPLNPAASVSGWLSPEYAMDAMYNAHGTSGSFWFLLRRGTVFGTGTRLQSNVHGSWPFRGLSPTYPALVDAYGSVTGARPKITSTESPLFLIGSKSSKSNVAFKSIHFHDVVRDPSHASYNYDAVGSLTSECIHIYTNSEPTEIHVFDDIRVSCYRISLNADGSDPVHNLFWNRCQIDKNYTLNGGDASAVYIASAVNAEFKECVLDELGYTLSDPSGRSFGSNRNHAFYIAGLYNEQFKFRGNVINRASYGGIQLRGGSGHLVSGNTIMRAGYAVPFGHDQNDYDDIFANSTNNASIRYHQADIINNFVSKPFNIYGASGTWRENAGFGVGAGRINKVNVYNNIIAHTGNSSGNCYGLKFSEMDRQWDNNTSESIVSGNIVYNWVGASAIDGGSIDFGVSKTTQGFPYNNLPHSKFKLMKNYFMEPNMTVNNTSTKGVVYETAIGFGAGAFVSTGNTFYRAANSGTYVKFSDTTSYNFATWLNSLTDTSSVYSSGVLNTWGAPTRDDVAYIGSLGLSTASGQNSFIVRALNNRKGDWDSRFMSEPLISYVRAGFAPIDAGSGSTSLGLGLTAFHALNLSVFHAIRRR